MRTPLFLAVFPLLLASSAVAADTQSMSGEAIVRSIGDNRVAVLVDTNNDQTIDQGFLLSSDLPVFPTTARSPGAVVSFTGSYVRVVYEKKVYDLYVAGYPEPPSLPEERQVTRFIGYALMHSSGDSGCKVDRAMTDAGACYNYGKE